MPRIAAASARATSARGRQEPRRTYSCGAWAPPPRGPRPSTVTGISAAKWLASLAPPRPAAAIGFSGGGRGGPGGEGAGVAGPATSRGGDRLAEQRARAREDLDRRLPGVHGRPEA